MSFGEYHGPLLSLDIIEVRELLQIGPQMARRESAFKARPPRGLGVVFAPQGFEDVDARILPVKIEPSGIPVFSRFDGPPRLVSAIHLEKPLGDFSGDLGNFRGRGVVLCNE